MKKIMKKIYILSSVAVVVMGLAILFAFNNDTNTLIDKGYAIGDVVADFKLKSTSGGVTSMAENRSAKGYIIVFTCNHCPFSKAYESRIMALDKKYASQGYPVLAINPNDPAAYEEDSFENMQAVAKSKGYTFEYLQDETQNVARAFGAARTPSVFVVKREGDKFIMQYIGGIDDNTQDANGVTKRYVEDAVNSLLVGKPVVVNVTKSVGCAIKWKGV
ncbi:peroxiredoxin [Arcicella aurantiaca]|uniref:Peroxiredoxin n=2 Tax=Arcicella aurantiaca TaxID=591202 RepID=A0A316DI34_9BACT|nr:peroxiredoxin [Arcicella aurantiaca]